uniref:Secreted protein n=1 Tax=Opuntia streptacantha TaxID=393608 RepID=A0A7C9DQV0_OPUST
MVQTTVLPVLTVFLTVLMTMAAALASSPEVGSSINMIEGFATSSTAIVSLFRCSVERPFTPGSPTSASLRLVSSTSSMISSTNIFLVSALTSDDNRSQAEKIKDS